MIRTLFFVFLFFLFQLSANKVDAQNSVMLLKTNAANFYGSKITNDYQSILATRFKHWQITKIASTAITSKLTENKGQKITIGLQINDNMGFNLMLESANLVSKDYKLKIQTPTGIKTVASTPDFLYKGKNKNGGAVRLAIKDGFISGSIQDNEKEYFIEPVKRFYEKAKADEFIVYQTEDLIDTLFSCGFTNAARSAANATQQNGYRPFRPLNNSCSKIKFVMVADFSMYQKFNYDISAIETELLSDLNASEVFFNGFNFDTNNLSDEGTDIIKFEASQIIVSICKACDITNKPYTFRALNDFLPWIKQNISIEGLQIHQYWTTYDLDGYLGFAVADGFAACSTINTQLHHFGGGIPVLRIQIAHETGHNLGCNHDNNVNASVNSFIMNAGLRINATRFSQLRDFGGIRYSSNLAIRDTIQPYLACIGDCVLHTCEKIVGLKVDSSYRGDGIKISWDGTGEFTVRYKLQNAAGFDSLNTKVIIGNSIILKNLNSCSAYFLQVQKKCIDGMLFTAGIYFSPFYFIITEKIINQRAVLYDLKVQFEKITNKEKDIYLKIDHKGNYLIMPAAQTAITVNNLFADGARHRIDILLDTNNSVCKSIVYFNAPYYRANSKKLLNVDFNDCQFPAQWKDSIYIKSPPGYTNPYFTIGNFSLPNWAQLPGNLDNTCMLFYERFNQPKIYNGVLSLMSPVIDITKVKDPLLSFDYKFLAYGKKEQAGYLPAVFKVMAFNGSSWQEIFRLENDEYFGFRFYRNIWDTIPERVFIPLKNYSNERFRLQFVFDDGSKEGKRGLYFFTAIDNILVDGYDSSASSNKISFVIFPNPSTDVIFIKNLPLAQTFFYSITDVLGRKIKYDRLENYKINISNLSKGIYFLTLFNNGIKQSITSKFVKF